MLTVSLHRLAQLELDEAAAYYGEESFKLAFSFLECFDTAIKQILEHPKASPIIHLNVRRKLIRRFPDAINYVNSGDDLRIVAVAHLSRHPTYWIGRS